MTFDDIYDVEIDDNGDYFYVIKDSGTTYRYRFDDPEAMDFFARMVDSGAVDMYNLDEQGEIESEYDD